MQAKSNKILGLKAIPYGIHPAILFIGDDLLFQDEARTCSICQKLLSLPITDIITTIDTYDLEILLSKTKDEVKGNRWLYYSRVMNKDRQDTVSNWFYRYSLCYGKRIWHIHGETAAPTHRILNDEMANKLTSRIQTYLPEFIKRYHQSQDEHLDFEPWSWVDLIMISEVYVLGFETDLTESGVCHLASRKNTFLPSTHLNLFLPIRDGKSMLSAFGRLVTERKGIRIIEDEVIDGNYEAYYDKCIEKIKSSLLLLNHPNSNLLLGNEQSTTSLKDDE